MANVMVQLEIYDEEDGVTRHTTKELVATHFRSVRLLRKPMNAEDQSGEQMIWIVPETATGAEGEPDAILAPDEKIVVIFLTTPDNPLPEGLVAHCQAAAAGMEGVYLNSPLRKAGGGPTVGQQIDFERSTVIVSIGDRLPFLWKYAIPVDEDLVIIPGSEAENRLARNAQMDGLADRLRQPLAGWSIRGILGDICNWWRRKKGKQ